MKSSQLFTVLRMCIITSSIFATTLVCAASDDAKQALLNNAVESCTHATEKRYGENAIKKIDKKGKWHSGLNGVVVKMKLKQKGKKAYKYKCLLNSDGSISHFKDA